MIFIMTSVLLFPHIFPSADSPRYPPAKGAMTQMFCIPIIICVKAHRSTIYLWITFLFLYNGYNTTPEYGNL